MSYSRFVAIGDSQTEGMCDGDDDAGYRGWADRLAEMLAEHNPRLRYANLAVRGRTTRQIRDVQLAPAVALQPDLVAAPLGMNDVLASTAISQVHRDLDFIYSELRKSDATVLISTFPNLARTVPIAKRIEARLLAVNEMMREFAMTYGFVLVDLHAASVLTDPRSWSPDRLHASPFGHQRFAAGAAHALGLPGSDPQWGEALPPRPPLTIAQTIARETQWARTFFIPWMIRRIRGVSLGDGREPKRPELTPVVPETHHGPVPLQEPGRDERRG
ncbi:SGNH/GDSL hydrolase family protein [Williamsia sp. 1135]|uniref:SGNH/GDSL hydrolase family protein n=1 Tax=Williamsia sp. 1135 TaxID=1889262 RepID=UPI000A0FBC9A|nr:SGNH/GDSL hydrolase family protein [Williamsia sp. 1135]ORM27775.1 lysophospholipase [Williamsia sp. 1135]